MHGDMSGSIALAGVMVRRLKLLRLKPIARIVAPHTLYIFAPREPGHSMHVSCFPASPVARHEIAAGAMEPLHGLGDVCL